jgi:hypothetical protein
VLTYDEMSRSLRQELDRWDTNKDGKIDLKEYKAYFRNRLQSRGNWPSSGTSPAGQPATPEEDDLNRKPIVYRVGKLPKELPPWFTQLDLDKDGQVGLYEWKQAGRPVSEFLAMDHNRDGFLTVEEVLRHEKAKAKAKKAKTAQGGSGGSGSDRSTRGPRPDGKGPKGGK